MSGASKGMPSLLPLRTGRLPDTFSKTLRNPKATSFILIGRVSIDTLMNRGETATYTSARLFRQALSCLFFWQSSRGTHLEIPRSSQYPTTV